MSDVDSEAVIHDEVEELIEFAEEEGYYIWSEKGLKEWEFWVEPDEGRSEESYAEMEDSVYEFVNNTELLSAERLKKGPVIVYISEIDVENES